MDKTREEILEEIEKRHDKQIMDNKIIAYLDANKADRVALEHKVIAQEYHRSVLALIEKYQKEGKILVDKRLSPEDIYLLLELGLLSENSFKVSD